MKKIFLTAVILTGILLIVGCQWFEDIGEPIIITPTIIAGSELEGNEAKFMWHSVKNATGYAMEISADEVFDNLLYSNEAITDTFHYIYVDSFEWYNTYYWRAKAKEEESWGKWSDIDSFKFDYTGIDLDTTYFPIKVGYIWCYEYHKEGWEGQNTYDECDTLTNRVVEFVWEKDTFFLSTQGEFYIVGITTGKRIKIIRNHIFVNSPLINMINVTPKELELDSTNNNDNNEERWEFYISFISDTLTIGSSYLDRNTADEPSWNSSNAYKIKCLDGVGIIHQSHFHDTNYTFQIEKPNFYVNQSYRLLALQRP